MSSQPEADDFQIILDVLCLVMVADNKASVAEKEKWLTPGWFISRG
jgi:hypothetical protein